jgi:hypothetical protein
MRTASPKNQDLARRLVTFEATRQAEREAVHENTSGGDASHARVAATQQVIEELRNHLVKLAGAEGFRSLLSRALALAKAEVPALHVVHVCADGSVEGLHGIGRHQEMDAAQEAQAAEQAGTMLVAHLLELLVTFIGESLTLRLISDAWPDAPIANAFIAEADLNTEGRR